MTHEVDTYTVTSRKSFALKIPPPSPSFPLAPAQLQLRLVVIRCALSDAGYADKCVTRLQLPVDPDTSDWAAMGGDLEVLNWFRRPLLPAGPHVRGGPTARHAPAVAGTAWPATFA